jgi:hypothetical protein
MVRINVFLIVAFSMIFYSSGIAQVSDTMKINSLKEITIYGKTYDNLQRLPKTSTTYCGRAQRMK